MDRDELAAIRNKKLGFVFQGFNLLSRTSALENVELPMLYTHDHMSSVQQRDLALHALEIVGLSDRADHYPNQLSAANSSGWPSPARWSIIPLYCWRMSRPGNLDTRTSVRK